MINTTSTIQVIHQLGQRLWLQCHIIVRSQRRRTFTASTTWTGYSSCASHDFWCLRGWVLMLPGVLTLKCCADGQQISLFALLVYLQDFLWSRALWTQGLTFACLSWYLCYTCVGPWYSSLSLVIGKKKTQQLVVVAWTAVFI